MRVRLIISGTIAAAVLGSVGSRLDAQSMSTLSNAKRVASNAVAATNEHTSKEQMVGDAPAAATKPASKAASATASGKTAAPAKKAAPKRDAAARLSAPAKSPKAASASGKGAAAPEEKGPEKGITLVRESFSYNVEGRRDPFISLIANGDLRPMISDLRLVTVIFDPAGRSVAIMRDVSTQEQYRVKSGQTLGRMRVSRIAPKAVTFTIEEYGFSRQEVLALNDTTRARSQ
jgi:hypothetical protein